MKTIFYHFRSKIDIFHFFHTCTTFLIKKSFRFHKISSKINIFMLFSRSTVKKPSRLTPFGTRISLLRLQNHSFHFFHTCPTYLLQNGIAKSRFCVQRSHFGLQSGPRRARPARPAGRAGWPSLAGPGWPARPPGPACRPVGCSAGGGGEEGRAKEGGSAPAEPRPPTPITAGGLFSI